MGKMKVMNLGIFNENSEPRIVECSDYEPMLSILNYETFGCHNCKYKCGIMASYNKEKTDTLSAFADVYPYCEKGNPTVIIRFDIQSNRRDLFEWDSVEYFMYRTSWTKIQKGYENVRESVNNWHPDVKRIRIFESYIDLLHLS